ncbi:MAG TPA: flavin reductase family protein [Clostridia bacterium]|jgi:flavin reductase (DIM6/NTAB) family NADH-FMN oxidoreductase RutF
MTSREKIYLETLRVLERMGVFLVAGKNPPNVMTLSWGAIGNIWNKPIIITPIRYTRHTYDLIEKYHEFTISVPQKDLSEALVRCGQISGRDYDKFKELHLHPSKARVVDTYIVADCGIHLECKVLYKGGMEGFSLFDENIKKQFYQTKNYHTMFFSEIVAAYTT